MLRFVACFGLFFVQGTAVRLHEVASRGPAPSVAALVPTYPPHFGFVIDFLLQWRSCPEGRAVMDVFVVFSNLTDASNFRRNSFSKGGFRLPYRELIVSGAVSERFYKSWKKMDGLAQLLDADWGNSYEFAVMMDAEISLADCQGFKKLRNRLRQKHHSKVIYGFRARNAVPYRAMRTAACAISNSPAPRHVTKYLEGKQLKFARAARSKQACGPSVMDHLQNQTGNFRVYTWWLDLPFVHMETARRMFDSWAFDLDGAVCQSACVDDHTETSANVEGGGLHALPGVARNLTVEAVEGVPGLANARQVASAMAFPPAWAAELGYVPRAYEHLIYQLYLVAHEGFTVREISLLAPDWTLTSPGEFFCRLTEADKARYAEKVDPIWQSHGCDPYEMPHGPPLLRFNMDKVQ